MVKAPKIYTNALVYIENLVVVMEEPLILDHLYCTLNRYWRIDHRNDSDSDDDNDDTIEKDESIVVGVGISIQDRKQSANCFKRGK